MLTVPPPHYIWKLSSLGVFIECACFLPRCRQWRPHSWQRTWRCSWSTRRPSWRRSKSLWLRTALPGRGRAATWSEHRYACTASVTPNLKLWLEDAGLTSWGFCPYRRICPGSEGSWRNRRRWRCTRMQTRFCRRRSISTRWERGGCVQRTQTHQYLPGTVWSWIAT